MQRSEAGIMAQLNRTEVNRGSMTRRFWGVLGRVLALALTSYCLIATSGTSEYEAPVQVCAHARESIAYQVSGDCGADGKIVVLSLDDECTLFVQGAAVVSLPSQGRFSAFDGTQAVDLSTSAWSLSGQLAEPTSETRSCTHQIQYHLGTIESELLLCRGTTMSCTAKLTRL
jgi:hypothetical protein